MYMKTFTDNIIYIHNVYPIQLLYMLYQPFKSRSGNVLLDTNTIIIKTKTSLLDQLDLVEFAMIFLSKWQNNKRCKFSF